MGELIHSIVIDELITKDVMLIRRALYPTSKLKLFFENVLMTGEKLLRIECEENLSQLYTFANSTKVSESSKIKSFSFFSKSTTAVSSNQTNTVLKVPNLNAILRADEANSDETKDERDYYLLRAMKILAKVKERQDQISDKLESYEQSSLNRSSIIILEAPKRHQKLYGEQIVTWLLLRGLVLIELNRIAEAIMMFKLMECYKDTAPRTKFAMFIAYYHLAELIVNYDICEYPLLVSLTIFVST